MGKKRSWAKKAKSDAMLHYNYYMQRACSMYAAQRAWKNMGNYFNASFAEATLFYTGWLAIWYDPVLKSYICGRPIPNDTLDIYGNYTSWSVYTINGLSIRDLNTSNSVLVYDSSARYFNGNGISKPYPPFRQIAHIVDEMCALYKSMRVNISSLGCPLIIQGTADQQLSMQNAIQMINDGTPYIFARNDNATTVDPEIKALRTEAPNNINSFSTEIDKCWSEMFSVLGVDNVGVNKAERLLVDEVNANNEQVNLIAHDKIASRNQALGVLNNMYGTDCVVVSTKASMHDMPVPANYSSISGGDSDDDRRPENPASNGGEGMASNG